MIVNQMIRAASRQLLAGCALLVLTALRQAQQTTGVPGSPGATTTIDGKYLPPPPPKFGGEINLEASEVQAVLAARRSCRPRARPTCC